MSTFDILAGPHGLVVQADPVASLFIDRQIPPVGPVPGFKRDWGREQTGKKANEQVRGTREEER